MEILTESWTFISFALANIATLLLSLIFFFKEPKRCSETGEDYVD